MNNMNDRIFGQDTDIKVIKAGCGVVVDNGGRFVRQATESDVEVFQRDGSLSANGGNARLIFGPEA